MARVKIHVNKYHRRDGTLVRSHGRTIDRDLLHEKMLRDMRQKGYDDDEIESRLGRPINEIKRYAKLTDKELDEKIVKEGKVIKEREERLNQRIEGNGESKLLGNSYKGKFKVYEEQSEAGVKKALWEFENSGEAKKFAELKMEKGEKEGYNYIIEDENTGASILFTDEWEGLGYKSRKKKKGNIFSGGNKNEKGHTRGFGFISSRDKGKDIHYELVETSGGFIVTKDGKDFKKISKSTRNYMQAETKFKKIINSEAKEFIRKNPGKFKDIYSNLFHSPNSEYFTQEEMEKMYTKD